MPLQTDGLTEMDFRITIGLILMEDYYYGKNVL